MNNETYIFLIDAQAERNSCNDYIDFISHPPNLHTFPVSITHFGMIEIASDIVFTQLMAYKLAFLPWQAINNATLIPKLLFNDRQNVIYLVFYFGFVLDLINQIRPIKAWLKENNIFERQMLGNIKFDSNGCCSR